MNPGIRLVIYDYLDYRLFLADWFRRKKELNPHFSHRLFARKASLASCGYFSEVASGSRNLSKAKVPNFLAGLELNEREGLYFDRMVAFNHAKTHSARQALYEAMINVLPLKIKDLKRGQMEYFSKWYCVAVREALAFVDVGDDFEDLASRLRPRITPAQAKWAIRLLHELGLIERDRDGRWRARHVTVLSKSDECAPLLVREFQDGMIGRAREALECVAPEERHISSTTMSISPAGMDRLKEAVEDFRNRVREIVQSDRGEDRVMQLNIQVFPLTGTGGPSSAQP